MPDETPAPRMRFSASKLQTWMSCSLQARFQYIDRLPKQQNAYAVFGSVVHDALAHYNITNGNIQAALDRFTDNWHKPENIGEHIDLWPRGINYNGARERGIRMIQGYHDKQEFEVRDIIAVEHRFLVPFGSYEIQGIVDLAEVKRSGRGQRMLRVVDYKTNKKQPFYTALAVNQQFTLYDYAVQQKEFWVGNGPDFPPLENGEYWWEFLKDLPKRGIWYHLETQKEFDVGERDMADYKRAYRVCQMIERAWEHNVFVPNISGDSCGFCLAGETAVVTREGTRTLRELAGTSPTLMTRYGKWIAAPVRSYGVQRLWRIVLQRGRSVKEIYATVEHEWLSHGRRTTTRDLKPGYVPTSVLGQGLRAKDIRPSPFGIAHGITFGDGTRGVGNRPGNIELHGEKDKQLAKFFPLCETKERPSSLLVKDLPKSFKDAPPLSESKSYLYGFLAGYLAADGNVSTRGQVTIESANRDNLQLVRDICYILGVRTNPIQLRWREGIGGTIGPLYRCTISANSLTADGILLEEHRKNFLTQRRRDSEWKVLKTEPTERVEEVFCAEVPEYAAFVLEDNVLTGNCPYMTECGLPVERFEIEDEDGWL